MPDENTEAVSEFDIAVMAGAAGISDGPAVWLMTPQADEPVEKVRHPLTRKLIAKLKPTHT